MADHEADRDPLEAAATEFVERHRRGENPSVEEYAQNHPESADSIRELLPVVGALERLRGRRERLSSGQTVRGLRKLQRLGDFRIVRELGRGGMGVVFEAEQESLDRRVAVKVLPQSSLLSRRQLQRFHREAQTAAGLHHTNVVPVFGVGEEGGYHYIVMQLIPGVGLDEILLRLAESRRAESADLSSLAATSPRSRAERMAEVADAAGRLARSDVEHAADPGIPICDGTRSESAEVDADTLAWRAPIRKPGVGVPPTVVVEPHLASPRPGLPVGRADQFRIGPTYWRNVARIGVQVADALSYAHRRAVLHRDIKPSNLILDQQGIVWVTDFGLAKAVESDSVSRTGDIVGTLRYMAPERLHGQADARSDVYSLGLTLYEMLALRPAYEGSDASSLLRKVAEGPPPRLASVAPGIPRDMETIIMKAIAPEPVHRYQSAGELAEDLRLFLNDRPIRARRASAVERLWRWCRRNRAVAGLAATVLALLALVAVVASVGYIRTRIANTRVNNALTGESRQRQKAEATAQLALEALDDIFEQFAPERMSELPQLSLDDASGSGIRVAVQPVLSKEVASLLEHLLVFYDRLAAQGGDEADLRRKVADANRRVGDIRAQLRQSGHAQAAYLRAIELYRRMEEGTPADLSLATEIARIYNNLGDLQVAAGLPEAGRSFHMDALETLDGPATAAGAPPAVRYELARTCYLLGRGTVPDVMPRPEPRHGGPPQTPLPTPAQRQNEQYLLRAIGLLEKLAQEQPAIPDYRHLLACCCRDLPPPGRSDPDGSQLRHTHRAIEILEQLVEDFPAVPGYQHDLAKAYLHVIPRLPRRSPAASEVWLRKALGVTEKLVAEHPNVPDYAASQVQVHFILAETLQHDRRPDEAELGFRKALSLQSSLVSRFPAVVPYRAWKAIIQQTLAKLLSDRKQMEEACSLLEASTVTLCEMEDAEAKVPNINRLLKRSYDNLADVYARLGREDLAREALSRARQYGKHSGPLPPLPRD